MRFIAKRSDTFLALSIFALAFLVYLPALKNGFAFDDLIHIVDNPLLKSSTSIADVFLNPMYPGDLYRPVLTLTYLLTSQYFGSAPHIFHLDNNLLHAANSMFVFVLFKSLLTTRAAVCGAILFALNPINVEAVANISGRSELLAAFFCLLCLIITARLSVPAWQPVHLLYLPLLVVCALGAYFSKESSLTLLLLAPLIVSWHGRERLVTPGTLGAFIALSVSACIYLGARFQVVDSLPCPNAAHGLWLDNALSKLSFVERLPLALSLLGLYAKKVFIFQPPSADYSFARIDPDNFWNWHSISWLAVSFLIIWCLQRRLLPREVRFGLGWFLVSFVITSNIFFPIGTIFAERLVYLPSVGMLMAFSFCIHSRLSHLSFRVVGFSLALLFSLQTVKHLPVWRDNTSLFECQSLVSGNSAKTAHNYGIVLRNQGKFDLAHQQFLRALEIYPAYSDAAYGVASVFAMKGIESGANHWLHKALEIDPGHLLSLNLLGRVQLNRGEIKEAEATFLKALARDTDFEQAQLGLFAALVALGDIERALPLRDKLAKNLATNPEFSKLCASLDQITNVNP